MKQVIVLKLNDLSDGTVQLSYLFWIAVKPGRESPIPVFTSTYKGATAEETSALQSGAVIERMKTGIFLFDRENIPRSVVTAQTKIAGEFAAEQAREDAKANPNVFYGVTLDSATGWSPVTL